MSSADAVKLELKWGSLEAKWGSLEAHGIMPLGENLKVDG